MRPSVARRSDRGGVLRVAGAALGTLVGNAHLVEADPSEHAADVAPCSRIERNASNAPVDQAEVAGVDGMSMFAIRRSSR